MTTAENPEPTRRDFIYVATGALAAVGAAGTLWPIINYMNPDASALALASTEVDISSLEPGMSITVIWRGTPVFIRFRTQEEIDEAASVSVDELPDQASRNPNAPDGGEAAPATDLNRSAGEGREAWIVMKGNCTHLGCVPLGEQGEYGGWFCPCHGSHYDTAGRIRKGPAPENLHIPPFEFISESMIKIG